MKKNLLIFCVCCVGGCVETPTKEPTAAERQQQALKDPFGYGKMDDNNKPNISGGGINEYDKKGMDKDMHSVFDP